MLTRPNRPSGPSVQKEAQPKEARTEVELCASKHLMCRSLAAALSNKKAVPIACLERSSLLVCTWDPSQSLVTWTPRELWRMPCELFNPQDPSYPPPPPAPQTAFWKVCLGFWTWGKSRCWGCWWVANGFGRLNGFSTGTMD